MPVSSSKTSHLFTQLVLVSIQKAPFKSYFSAPSKSSEVPRAKLVIERFSSMAEAAKYDEQWHDDWQKGVDPGQLWDAGRSSPLLTHLLSSGQLSAQGKRAFVPGCGRGYDVFTFASAGAALAVGLDLTPEAIAAASAEQAKALANSPPSASAACELVSGNFFSYSHSSGQPFDIGYDYVFLCALHPDMRRDWAKSWARILAPGGELVTQIFPVGGVPASAPKRNPPWEVSPELCQELLLPEGFEQIVLEPIPEELSHKPRAGREWLGRWRRTAGVVVDSNQTNVLSGSSHGAGNSKL